MEEVTPDGGAVNIQLVLVVVFREFAPAYQTGEASTVERLILSQSEETAPAVVLWRVKVPAPSTVSKEILTLPPPPAPLTVQLATFVVVLFVNLIANAAEPSHLKSEKVLAAKIDITGVPAPGENHIFP
jgi:hypothetical protein